MRAFAERLPPPPSHPDHELITSAIKRNAEMDLGVRLKLKELKKQIPAFLLTRMLGGSGFSIAQILRHFFSEYVNRIISYGPHSLPTSFNVVESFLSFSERFHVFDL